MKRGAPKGFETLIEAVYDAALDVQRWPAVLDQVRQRLGASNALLFTPQVGPDDGMWIGLGYTAQAAQDYASYFHEKDVWYRAADQQGWLRGQPVFYSNELIEAPRFARSEFYNDHCRQFDIFHGCWNVTSAQPAVAMPFTAFGFYRSHAGDSFASSDVIPLRRIAPHLHRALEIHWRLRSAGQAHLTGLALLEQVPCAVVLLSDTGQVLHANRRARTLLSAPDGLGTRRRWICASDPVSDRALARLIGHSVSTGLHQGEFAGGALRIARPSGKAAWNVLVTPLPVAADRPVWAPGRVTAALFITDPEAHAHVPATLLQAWFGLTPSEARVALDVANGYSSREIAERAGVTWHTVRAHLKTLYEKMGVTRQTELARKVLTCAGREPAEDRPI
jgi:DNA-binding CsgD family transcriptional regulator/PAS domain-containing protein